MREILLTCDPDCALDRSNTVFCPSAQGLSAAQMDLAFLMPRMNHNQVVRETPSFGEWAAVLAADPFGSEAALFDQLQELGYIGVTNWPSSILLEGVLQQAMTTIPASPEFEYAYLARAREAGLKTMGFFRSLSQARIALDEGLDCLVLHPGLLEPISSDASALVQRSLQRMLETIRSESKTVTILVYTSNWHERYVALSELPVDGLIRFESGS